MTNDYQDNDQDKSPLRDDLDDLNKRMGEMQKDSLRSRLTENGLRILRNHGLNPDLLTLVSLDNEEKFRENMERLTGKPVKLLL